jgi:hypothetical protein
MKKKIILLFICCFTTSIFAQDYKFGKVSKEELEESFYPLDSTADAAYLYKNRRTYFDYSQSEGFVLITDIHQRIKIYTKDGFDMATKSITYYKPDSGDDESVSSIKGVTFNLENGKIVQDKLSKKSIFKEKINKYRSKKKITMPNVKEGSILELRYRIRSPYDRSISDLNFQFSIPVKRLDLKVEIPEYYIFNERSKGYYNIPVKKSSKNNGIGNNINYVVKVSTFQDNNIPAINNDEPYVSSIYNYRGGVKFELAQTNFVEVGGSINSYSTSWEEVSKKIHTFSGFGSELNKTSYFKDDLSVVLEGTTNDNQKIMAIFNHVKSKVKWNDVYGKYTDKGVRKAYKGGIGNIADINLMLTAMLREANLNANPVLVSTRNNGVPLFPTLKGFNYVITMVEFADSSYVLLDASDPFSLPNILPKRALNWNGRKVEKDGASSWVKLTSSKHALEDNNVIVKVSDDGMVEGVLRSKYSNLNALTYRKNKNHLKEDVLISQLEEKHEIEIDEFKLLNKVKLSKPVVERIKFTSEDLVEGINGKLYIEPLLFFASNTNPFKLETRKFPVDFGTPWKDKNRISIQIPEGYVVESLPESLAIGLPEDLGVFKYQLKQAGNKITVISILQFNSAIIAPQYYQTLKDFYGKVVEKQSEKIVLVKK